MRGIGHFNHLSAVTLLNVMVFAGLQKFKSVRELSGRAGEGVSIEDNFHCELYLFKPKGQHLAGPAGAHGHQQQLCLPCCRK
jgi:hypothetical protein